MPLPPPLPDPRRRVMLDLDDTVFEFTRACWHHLDPARSEAFDRRGQRGYHRFDEVDAGRIGEAMGYAASTQAATEIGVFDGAVEGVAAWRAAGLHIGICTRRRMRHTEETQQILKDLGIEFDHYLGRADADKIRYCSEHRIAILVDDHPHTIERASAAGIAAVALRWGHNEHCADLPGVYLVDDWEQLSQTVLALSGVPRVRPRLLAAKRLLARVASQLQDPQA